MITVALAVVVALCVLALAWLARDAHVRELADRAARRDAERAKLASADEGATSERVADLERRMLLVERAQGLAASSKRRA